MLNLPDSSLRLLSQLAAAAPYSPGEVIFVAQEEPMAVGLLLSGSTCEVRQIDIDATGAPAAASLATATATSSALTIRGAGELVGTDGYFSAAPRAVEIVGAAAGVIAVLSYADIERVLRRRDPRLASSLTHAMAQATSEAAAAELLSMGIPTPTGGVMS